MRLLLLSLVLLSATACRSPAATEPSAAPAAAPVRVASPEPVAEPRRIRAVGRIEATREAGLGFRTGGIVERVDVEIGDAVRAGQRLARLRSTDVDARVSTAREQREQARRDLARAEDLLARQLVARERVDNARTALAVADAVLRDAEFTRRHTELRADADGRVLARLAEPGEVVAAGQPVLRVGATVDGWLVRVALADRDALALEPGIPARVTIAAAGAAGLPARVTRIGGTAAAASGAVEVELALDPGDVRLLSGLIADVVIDAPSEPALAVPVAALLHADAGRARVYVLAGDRAEPRTLRTGRLRDDRIEVLEGLAAGDTVVVEGAAWIDPGSRVRVLR